MSERTGLRIDFGRLEESNAVVRLSPVDKTAIASATLYGPLCEFARTLPTSTRFGPAFAAPGAADAALDATVMEPCYWTPELPFLYELTANVVDQCGERTVSRRIGLRRWTVRGANFFLDGRRRVLRGAAVEALCEDDVAGARAAEAAILTRTAASDALDAADRLGVGLIVDVRGADATLDVWELAWRPSVLAVVVDARQAEQLSKAGLPAHLILARAADSPLPGGAGPVVFEVSNGGRPPSVAASHRAPVIAVRRGSSHGTMAEARAACDRLQADLAPQLDLAGYFVEAMPRG